MKSLILVIWYLLTNDPSDVERLRRTAPQYLTTETASVHLATSRAVADEYDLDYALLLAIAYNESRYASSAVGPEAGGLVSCGVMTPTPVSRCPRGQSLADGYRAGAAHLREWLEAQGTLQRALTGYAGGYALLRACTAGPVIIRPGKDGCQHWLYLTKRAEWISGRRVRS